MSLPPNFTHLRVHSHFTLLGATPSVADLAAQAAADQLTHLALTDRSALYGAVSFSRVCREQGVLPIIGLTIQVSPPPGEMVPVTAVAGDLVLLAANRQGYQSLCRLSSVLQSDPHRNRHALIVDWDTLKAHRDGLLCLSGGRRGWLARLLRAGQEAAAARVAARLGGLFTDHCYLALELHQPEDTAVARQLVALGERFGLPPVAVQPVYTLKPAEKARLRLLAAIDHNCRLPDVPDAVLPDEGNSAVDTHWLSPEAMAARFADFPQALAAVGQVVDRCGEVLPDGRPLWPGLSLPEGQSPDSALAEQTERWLAEKATAVDARQLDQYRSRLEKEQQTIQRYGFAPLFLMVADIVDFARRQGIPVSTRGSVANSLVAFATGITTVDPIEHALLFERFLNPARSSLPDIDLDFCSRRRDEVLAYVRRTYGANRVALVATISTMQPKSAVRETAKAYGYEEAKIKQLTALTPGGWHPDPRRRDMKTLLEVSKGVSSAEDRRVLEDASALVAQPHHLSVHPGGVVVTPGPLTDTLPVQMAPKGFLITQFDHVDVEAIGLPKLDLLGIRALTVLADTADMVRTHFDSSFRLEDISLDDAETAVMLAAGDTIGVFQFESTGAQRTLRQLRAANVRDLAVANAFFKPGPATGGMAAAFIRRYRGEEPVSFMHPALEPIFRQTQGVMLFQEQVLRVATEVAGLDWAAADQLRKGMSKFQSAQMAQLQQRFVAGCQSGAGLTGDQAEMLWQQVMAFAGYGFNQGHATAYADVSYRSAYLKAHFPAAFLWARLQDHGGFHHPVIYLAEARRLGIGVMPPHVNVSGRKIVLSGGADAQWRVRAEDRSAQFLLSRLHSEAAEPKTPALWLGLGQVRDLRRTSVAAIVVERGKRPFASLRDLLARVTLQPKEVTHLIQCGALDGLGPSRTAMLAEAAEVSRAGSAHQLSLDLGLATAVAAETPEERMKWEKQLLGWPVSVHPLQLLKNRTGLRLRQLPETGGQRVRVVGVRLPGWTGSRGFFLDDGEFFVVVGPSKGVEMKSPRAWEVVMVNGRYRTDDWGGSWLEAEGWSSISA